MEAMINVLAERIQHEYSLPPPEVWTSRLTQEEFTKIRDECHTMSQFDEANLRKIMFERAFHTRDATYKVYQSPQAKIIAIFDTPEQEKQVPWELWWRSLRMFYRGRPFTIVFLAHPLKRKAPAKNMPFQPKHINGGYTYPCKTNFVCIYRAEDATRVLLHELFHASCSDNMEDGLDLVEAKTEAWAELIYAGFLAHGGRPDMMKNIRRQSDWMRAQNGVIKNHHMESKGENPHEFPWRYTIGKEQIWKTWGIYRPSPGNKKYWNGSVRLTPVPTPLQKQLENVSQDSTIL